MTNTISASWLSDHLPDRSVTGITRRTRFLIQSGLLPLGSRLPSLRELAFCMEISPATLCLAWAELRKDGIIEGRGRLGSWVCQASSSPRPRRRGVQKHAGRDLINLAAAIPDRSLLPPLTEALSHVAQMPDVNSYAKIRITPALESACRESWAYQAEAFLATNGGFCALNETFSALLSRGAVVAVETPTATATLDILEHLGVTAIPVVSDHQGPCPRSLARALLQDPAAFVLQPRVNGITGRHVSPERLAAIAALLKDKPSWIIEWDALDALSHTPPASLGHWLPNHTVHIRSYSKSMAPDLRLAVLSASSEIVAKIHQFRAFGAGWTSRILQEATAWLLGDWAAQDCIRNARAIYANRRRHLVNALRDKGVTVDDEGSGLTLWLPVQNEQAALAFLEENGVLVSAGHKHSLASASCIRVAYSNLQTNFDWIGGLIATATRLCD
ncbi:GntR family transcriptional regulator [Gluconacetobacter liquefaciens]|uniref:Aminotransferase class I/II-fold pyridoxal phosphate-dependent enzyme n=1 Tax=Gluconacetobacter liquefaciens TaxID=89584 RepID=A0A370G331_GLULI|nr:aminotransferase class I/II-fold pyridoxal phosphate-dependent enzyme [Gluconacetobacter liquefaciens]MBB2186570.1 aminotransferase class I/II-fold pyridoxal phosphate-dependent enzyme [Gluconacetobacter liquefaciens]RDI38238.1 DNA-binding transcriptional MocR family regulator [Gluconacetobacter liquefaciens]GBR10352.1 transcriptional regulator protein [Gluconacetobacter liquefaciens NRIC 0522]GEB36706.1 GntR family transcriptional regulator [Gluconacetobacter liquefaciens]